MKLFTYSTENEGGAKSNQKFLQSLVTSADTKIFMLIMDGLGGSTHGSRRKNRT